MGTLMDLAMQTHNKAKETEEIKMEYKQSINEIVAAAHDTALEKGFYEDIFAAYNYLDNQGLHAMQQAIKRDFVLAQLSKIDSEVGETVGAIQKRGIYSEDVAEEMADILIRVCDLAGYLEINLGRTVHRKMLLNKQRPRKHGKLC